MSWRRRRRRGDEFGWEREPVRKDDAFEQWWRAVGFRELRQLLLWRWDPLGVDGDFPWAEDEYDMYARPLAELLHAGADAPAVAAMLGEVERESIEFGHGAADVALGERIVRWYEGSREAYLEFGDRWERLRKLI